MKPAIVWSLVAAALFPLSVLAQNPVSPPSMQPDSPGSTKGAVSRSSEPNVSSCTGCHSIKGYKASFPRVYHVPMIGGQNAKYIESALQAYKKGDRDHPTMRSIAAGLSDHEIAALAAYYAARGAAAK